MYGKSNMEIYITICKIDSQGNLLYGSGNSETLYQSRGVEWGGKWKGGSKRKGYNIYRWLIHVEV